jgi:hypothetical protein
MPIEVTDKRTRPSSISTGTSVQPAGDADHVLVQPLTTYLEGSEHKGPHSEPYAVPRHHANELKGHGIAKILEPKTPAVAPVDPDVVDEEDVADVEDEDEVEVPDDTSRAPDPDQTTASTVPALPGAEPIRPAPGPVPPAAVSDAPQPARRGRGRPAGRKGWQPSVVTVLR